MTKDQGAGKARDFDAQGAGVHFFSNYWIATHSFTFTTKPDNSIAHTYSGGNKQNDRGWNLDRPIDIKAAEDAIKSGFARKVGNSTLDPYVAKAFAAMDKKENEHQDFGVAKNCKWEATDLLHKARDLKKADDRLDKAVRGQKAQPDRAASGRGSSEREGGGGRDGGQSTNLDSNAFD